MEKQLVYKKNPSKLKKVMINIDSAYKWGTCWTLEEKRAFEDEIYPALMSKGFRIHNGDGYGSCETIKEKDGTYLYLHPMQFSGYMTIEDIQKVMDVLTNAKTVNSVSTPILEDVERISDREYEYILVENAKLINEWIEKNPHKDGFDFVKQYRIKRDEDKCGYCSDDVDIKFVNNFIAIKKILKPC